MARSPRERLVLGAGVAVAAVVVLWGLLWMPLRDATTQRQTAVAQKSRLLADLRRAETLAAAPVGDDAADASGQSLVVLVDSTAQSLGLAATFTRTRPDGDDAISISFQNAAFDTLLGWLLTLERSYGVAVESASFTGAAGSGFVSGQISLRRL